MGYHGGLDFGTGGVRLTVIDDQGEVVYQGSKRWQKKFSVVQDPATWVDGMDELLCALPGDVAAQMKNICASGTSASVCLIDTSTGKPSRPALMYNFNTLAEHPRGNNAMEIICENSPAKHTVQSGTSSLAKLVTMHLEQPLAETELLASQADYISAYLRKDSRGRLNIVSEWNNALKLGYDVEKLVYPKWMARGSDLPLATMISSALPPVVEPGAKLGPVGVSIAGKYGLPSDCQVVAGTTDSIAAFIAAGATSEGEGTAVTSLGSTMAIKMLSANPVEDASLGVYSHRLGDFWLVGGASNVGCMALIDQGFTSMAEIEELSMKMNPMEDIDLNYYPLVGNNGERFPTSDPEKEAEYYPRADNREDHLKGILQGIAKVEKHGFDVLKSLGASEVTQVITAGGGAANIQWMRMRQRILGVQVSQASNGEASYGAALLARGLDLMKAPETSQEDQVADEPVDEGLTAESQPSAEGELDQPTALAGVAKPNAASPQEDLCTQAVDKLVSPKSMEDDQSSSKIADSSQEDPGIQTVNELVSSSSMEEEQFSLKVDNPSLSVGEEQMTTPSAGPFDEFFISDSDDEDDTTFSLVVGDDSLTSDSTENNDENPYDFDESAALDSTEDEIAAGSAEAVGEHPSALEE